MTIKKRTSRAKKRRTFAAAYAEMVADEGIMFRTSLKPTRAIRYFRVTDGVLQAGIPFESGHGPYWEESTFTVNYLARQDWTTRYVCVRGSSKKA